MSSTPSPRQLLVSLLVALALVAGACGDDDSDSDAPDTTEVTDDETTDTADDDGAQTTTEAPDTTETPATTAAADAPTSTEAGGFEGDLVGLFALDPGECSDPAAVSGSYFRMVQQGGTLAEGPFVPNGDSTCADTTYSPLAPGTDGGLITGQYQPAPDPAFDADGNGVAAAIMEPTPFFAVAFAAATEEDGSLPSIVATGGQLSGDTSAWTAFYGDLVFNQGAPKPDGSLPGLTSEVSGTIDAATGEFVLDWTSEIVGGAFNGFTGVWHLEGTFTPS